MRHQTDGFAIVVVLLVTTMILLSLMTSASLSALGTRRNTTDERASYQALLVSESGINTIAQRLAANNYRVALNENTSMAQAQRDTLNLTNLNTFIETNGLAMLVLPDGTTTIRATTFNTSGARPRATIQSVSTLMNGSTKTLLQDVWLEKPPSINISVPGALTSRPSVNVQGGGILTGIWGRSSSGLINITATSTTANVPVGSAGAFTLNVHNSSLIGWGHYLRIGSSPNAYRVEHKDGNTLTLRPVGSSVQAHTISSGSAVQLVHYGVTTPVADLLTVNTLHLTDTSGFALHDRIFVRDTHGSANPGTDHTGHYQGIVTAKDTKRGTLTVTWQGSIPNSGSPIPEGAGVRRDVNAVTTANDASTGGGGVMEGGVSRFDTVRVPAGNALFEQTFGMSEAQLLRQTGVPIQTAYPGGILSGINYIRANIQLSGGSSRLCGTGILIVDGDLTFNGTCDAGFIGIIYVKGSYDQQGNSFIKGAVIVQGNGTKVAGNTSTTTINPTGSKIIYDPESLIRYGSLLSPWHITPIAGTWRER